MTTGKKESLGVNPELIRALSDEEMEQRGWQLEVTDRSMLLTQEKMGLALEYGMRVEGFDGVLIHEPGGGGSVSIPFVIWTGDLWIGLLEEERKNMGGRVLGAPGGFLDPGEKHFEAADREFTEEVGIGKVKISDTPLGEPGNPNRAFFDTSREGEGIHFYPVEFLPEHVEYDRFDDFKVFSLRFKEGVIVPKAGDRVAEKIFGCRFYRWQTPATKSDMFANAMFSRLFIHLVETGRATASFRS